ncbi:hypothetical protein [Halpernia frigidisoli]|uniref:Lipoprotein n=1 Tax=Halpernia frigidisoli TaxID=1125876 RepID=A0A1I3D272_9FLAO|nr:hypothetical protein [Halpernia frigidisoli]SFH80601.1 hypothetical protein SAMN05443292_0206 [Halpernia frigidisoli]
MKNKILLFLIIGLFSCKESHKNHLQNYIGQDYLDEVCKRHIKSFSINSNFQKLRILTNDSIKNQKKRYSEEILKSCFLDKQFQELINEKIITKRDLNYFLHSKNNVYTKDFFSLKTNCNKSFYNHNDGRDVNTSFYSQPFYSEDKKVFIFQEGLDFPEKEEINLICVNNRIGKSKVIHITTFYYPLPPKPTIYK